jgi:hypothetical protein
MCCTTWLEQISLVKTTQLAPAVCTEPSDSVQAEPMATRRPLLTSSWVVFIDEDGKRRLRLRWRVEESPEGGSEAPHVCHNSLTDSR